ncbi:MAG: hypothetical protein ACO1TE_19285 [Prosthecobacter sp.]
MNATPPTPKTLRQTVPRGRFSPYGGLTSGGRITLLLLVSGVMLLAQAWQVAHRYGQHASTPHPASSQTTELQIPNAISRQ